jgi:hypothetical protein
MPELVPLLDRLAEQVDRPATETLLTMAATAGCDPRLGRGRLGDAGPAPA